MERLIYIRDRETLNIFQVMESVKDLPSKGVPLLSSAILTDEASVTLEAVKRVIKQEKEIYPQEPSSTEAPWKSVLIGSNKKNKTMARPRFLDSDGRRKLHK